MFERRLLIEFSFSALLSITFQAGSVILIVRTVFLIGMFLREYFCQNFAITALTCWLANNHRFKRGVFFAKMRPFAVKRANGQLQ